MRNTQPEDVQMKKLLLIAAAAAAVSVAVPASAQVVIRGGENGVAVRVGPGHDRGLHRGHYRGRGHYREHFARGDCRVVRSRIVTPGGRVIVKTRQVCR
jgi:hypothetical protein